MSRKLFLSLSTLTLITLNSFAANTHYVNTSVLRVRLAPSTDAERSNDLYKAQRVKVYEIKDGWARISRYKQSVVDGKFAKRAHWTYSKHLTSLEDTSKKQEEVEQIIRKELKLDTDMTHLVLARRLKVRLAPNVQGDHTHSLDKNDRVRVYEFKGNWARISPYKNDVAKWVYGKYLVKIPTGDSSSQVQTQTPKPVQSEKKQAEIVKTKQPFPITEPQVSNVQEVEAKMKEEMQKVQAPKSTAPVKESIPVYEPIPEQSYSEDDLLIEVISDSDKYERYKDVFLQASRRLYKQGVCKISDFKRTQGWIEISDDRIFFTYCGQFKRSNKIYLNIRTGETTK